MLPQKYSFINSVGVLPKMLAAAFQFIGIKEVPGKGNNAVIMHMAEVIGIKNIYTGDALAWCALFINFIIYITGKPMLKVGKDLYNFLRAKYLLNWGVIVAPGDEMFGDLLIFDRPDGGHAAFYIAESKTTFHVFGGNQSDMIGFTEIPKIRLTGARRFYATAAPASVKKYFIDSSGIVSTNEA